MAIIILLDIKWFYYNNATIYCIYYYSNIEKNFSEWFEAYVTNVQYDGQINATYHRELYTQYETACCAHEYCEYSPCNMMSVVREHDTLRCFRRANSSIFLSTMYTCTYMHTNICIHLPLFGYVWMLECFKWRWLSFKSRRRISPTLYLS